MSIEEEERDIGKANDVWVHFVRELEENAARLAKLRTDRESAKLAAMAQDVDLALQHAFSEQRRLVHERTALLAKRELLTLADVEHTSGKEAPRWASRLRRIRFMEDCLDIDGCEPRALIFYGSRVIYLDYAKIKDRGLVGDAMLMETGTCSIPKPTTARFLRWGQQSRWVLLEDQNTKTVYRSDTLTPILNLSEDNGKIEMLSSNCLGVRKPDGWTSVTDIEFLHRLPDVRQLWENGDYIVAELPVHAPGALLGDRFVLCWERSSRTRLWICWSGSIEAVAFHSDAVYIVDVVLTEFGLCRRLVIRNLSTKHRQRFKEFSNDKNISSENLMSIPSRSQPITGLAVESGCIAIWDATSVWIHESRRKLIKVFEWSGPRASGEYVRVLSHDGCPNVFPPLGWNCAPFGWVRGRKVRPSFGLEWDDAEYHKSEPRGVALTGFRQKISRYISQEGSLLRWDVAVIKAGGWFVLSSCSLFGFRRQLLVRGVRIRALNGLARILNLEEPGIAELRAVLSGVAERAIGLELQLLLDEIGNLTAEVAVKHSEDLRNNLWFSCANLSGPATALVSSSLSLLVRKWLRIRVTSLDEEIQSLQDVDLRILAANKAHDEIVSWRMVVVREALREVGWAQLDVTLAEIDRLLSCIHDVKDEFAVKAAASVVASVWGLSLQETTQPATSQALPELLNSHVALIQEELRWPEYSHLSAAQEETDRVRADLAARIAAFREVAELDKKMR